MQCRRDVVVRILWLILVVFVILLAWIQIHGLSFSSRREAIQDQCSSGCDARVGNLVKGYGTTFIQGANDNFGSDPIQNFCLKMNGNNGKVIPDSSLNYVLNYNANSFACVDPWNPSQALTSAKSNTITSHYENKKQFKTIDDATNYCSNGINNLGPIVVDSSNGQPVWNFMTFTAKDGTRKLGCRFPLKTDTMMPSRYTPKYATWAFDTKKSPTQMYKIGDVSKHCRTLNGGRSDDGWLEEDIDGNPLPNYFLDANGNPLPNYTMDVSKNRIVYNCTSYWTGKPITNADMEEKVVIPNPNVNLYISTKVDYSLNSFQNISYFCDKTREFATFGKITPKTDGTGYFFDCSMNGALLVDNAASPAPSTE